MADSSLCLKGWHANALHEKPSGTGQAGYSMESVALPAIWYICIGATLSYFK